MASPFSDGLRARRRSHQRLATIEWPVRNAERTRGAASAALLVGRRRVRGGSTRCRSRLRAVGGQRDDEPRSHLQEDDVRASADLEELGVPKPAAMRGMESDQPTLNSMERLISQAHRPTCAARRRRRFTGGAPRSLYSRERNAGSSKRRINRRPPAGLQSKRAASVQMAQPASVQMARAMRARLPRTRRRSGFHRGVAGRCLRRPLLRGRLPSI
jgi:hypothetical protein